MIISQHLQQREFHLSPLHFWCAAVSESLTFSQHVTCCRTQNYLLTLIKSLQKSPVDLLGGGGKKKKTFTKMKKQNDKKTQIPYLHLIAPNESASISQNYLPKHQTTICCCYFTVIFSQKFQHYKNPCNFFLLKTINPFFLRRTTNLIKSQLKSVGISGIGLQVQLSEILHDLPLGHEGTIFGKKKLGKSFLLAPHKENGMFYKEG